MAFKVIQLNVNRSWPAFDLMVQHMDEGASVIGIVSEPPRRRQDVCDWFASGSGLAAIIVRNPVVPLSCTLIRRGRDIVAVRFGDLVVSCYVSPNSTRNRYLEFLDELGDVVGEVGGRSTLIGGDFNARSASWDPVATNWRGTLVEEWAAEKDLRLINVDVTPTCINPRVSSVVDLTWTTADLLKRLVDWSINADMKSLSDHSIITYDVVGLCSGPFETCSVDPHPRWNYHRMDVRALSNVLEWDDVAGPAEDDSMSAESFACCEGKRRLYATVVLSVMLYGAPVWYDAMRSTTSLARRGQAPIFRVQRFVAIRVIAAYRSVSLEAATLLARMPPFYLLAAYYNRTYARVRELKSLAVLGMSLGYGLGRTLEEVLAGVSPA
ncbi:uncharacterized protein LOC116853607 [Odontomachus brunneus]|uniref:uncharacterized protein LOC116853607 n=1 Tax=Odontomachus brunneus TaxID=486640 RepID=UPI0013F27A68|nr:uncharacterized protein LOC116853607 [Odontomachus brunneus]